MSEIDATIDVAGLTVQLLSAYLANNTVASEDIAELIRSTKAALIEETDAIVVSPEPPAFTPAVSVRKSLASPDHIISLIDGKPYKTLKRHLASRGLTPAEYRSRYNLPLSYPMVAPTYAAHRRDVAQKIGLGSRKPQKIADGSEAMASIQDLAAPSITEAASPAPSQEKELKWGPPPGKARARKSKPNVRNDDVDARGRQPSGPVYPADKVANEEALESHARCDKPQLKRSLAQRSKKRSEAEVSPNPARSKTVASANKADDASGPDTTVANVATPAGDTGNVGEGERTPPKRRGKLGLFKPRSGPAEP